MKFNYAFVILFFGISSACFSQPDAGKVLIKPKTYDRIYEVSTNWEGGSSVLPNSLFYKFAFGGFIDNNLKDKTLDKMQFSNSLGNVIHSRIEYREENRKLLGLESAGFQFGIQHFNQNELGFTTDLYQTIFYGNTSFKGRYADLNTTAFKRLNYFSVFGGINFSSISNKHYLKLSLVLNSGNQYSDASLDQSTLYTSLNADSIAFDGAMKIHYVNQLKPSFFDIYGLGPGVEAEYRFQGKKGIGIEFKMQQAGIIFWNGRSREFQQTEAISWTGIEVMNILQMPDPLTNSNLSDSLSNFLESKSNTNKLTTYTPAFLSLKFSKSLFSSKLQLIGEVNHRFFSVYKPQFTISGQYRFSEKFMLSPEVGYGGYSKLKIGLGAEIQLGKFGVVEIGSRYFGNMIFSQSLSGFGGYLQLTYKL